MKRLAIIGAGHLGRLIAYYATQERHYTVVGFFDDVHGTGTFVETYPVLGAVPAIVAAHRSDQFDEVMIAIGYKHFGVRQALFEHCVAAGIPIGRMVHSASFVDPSCRLGPGAVVLPGCVLDRNAVLEDNVMLNCGCAIAHDSTVGAHCVLAPRVAVCGFVTIGPSCFIGVNTTIIDNLSIAGTIQTGGGTVVIRSLEHPGLYVGNPARFVR